MFGLGSSKLDTPWEPMVASGLSIKDFLTSPAQSVPIKMRRMVGGKYVYRDATPEEVQDYIEGEAW